MKIMRSPLHALALASVCLIAANASAQVTAQTVTAQTGDGLLTLQATMPPEAHAGNEFRYTVKVTNSSDNMTLHDIVLKQRKTDGFTVDSVSMQTESANEKQTASSKNGKATGSDGKKPNDAKSNAKKSDAKKSDDKKSDDKKADASSGEHSESAKSAQSESSSGQSQGNKKQIKIDTLKPGESQTFVVKATADKEGELQSCLQISSYTPAICLSTKIVKPDLQLTKTAPENANRCDVIELAYTVKNDGSGDVGPIQISDDLGEGLETIDGENSLKFDIDGLPAGDTRKFVAKVFAKKPGSFTSRATAKATDSDLQSRSQETTTKVNAADLAVNVTGPKQIYGGKTATFTATVANTGNAEANNVNVKVMWPEEASFGDMSKVSMKRTPEQAGKTKGSGQQPTPAKNADEGNDKESVQSETKKATPSDPQPTDREVKMAEKTFQIESLAPGQTAQFEYLVRPADLTDIPTKVEATYICDVDAAEDQEQAKNETVATAMTSVKVVRLAALQIMIVDEEDPVSTGAEVTYNTRVWNEGDADDANVQLKLTLPEGLEFVSAQGPTEFKQDGATVTFEPIEVMKAGQRGDYKLVAKATGTGSVKMKAELSSETLDESVTSEEPTELFDENATE